MLSINNVEKIHSIALLVVVGEFLSQAFHSFFPFLSALLKFEDLLNVFSSQTVVRRWSADPLKQKYLIKYLRSINIRRFVVDIPPAHVKDFLIVVSCLSTNFKSYLIRRFPQISMSLWASRRVEEEASDVYR